ncbi:MAG: NERD domain-containing protein [Thermoflexus sp.]|uniref:nuclease-related domain-containing protein n=1 Tax=Thermoflexus sp. TaxID=1969742 RepID=UPI0025DA9717|nr:nuclease-related domain-containing protein [Thermoflexus sp.]MCS6963050.1 NERD domain-containing protein [Thermoflexus sp.]MDW8185380.1 nuclease-related domain-containing protein [Anaerolineae bacterium]
MKVVRNEAYIRRRATIGNWAFPIGYIILILGLVTSLLYPQLALIPVLAFFVGFGLTQIGIYYIHRFVRPDRPEAALTQALKGLDDRYVLYHYMLPAAHVLIGPDGVRTFVVKWQRGEIRCRNDRWSQPMGPLRRFLRWMAQDTLGNPTREAQLEAEALRRYFARHLDRGEIPIQPVIVFTHPEARLDVEGCSIPVVHGRKLKEWLRKEARQGTLPRDLQEALWRILPAPDSEG